MSCGVGRRCSLDPALLWLWRGPAATALIRFLAWEPLCVEGAALKKPKNKNKMIRADLPSFPSSCSLFTQCLAFPASLTWFFGLLKQSGERVQGRRMRAEERSKEPAMVGGKRRIKAVSIPWCVHPLQIVICNYIRGYVLIARLGF